MQTGKTPKIQDYYSDLQAPNPGDMALQLEQLVQQGVISPEQAQASLVESSDFNNISTDPKIREIQIEALNSLQDISGSGGLTGMDRANLSRIQSDEDTAARGKREAIIQNAQMKGMGGSGFDYMAQLQNQQDSATRNSQRNMDITGMAQQRALDALIQGGSMAGQIQNQDFNQQAQRAQANDAISKFNAQNIQNANFTNVATRNAAQEANLANKQNIANQNVGLRNQQQQYNKNLIQQNFDNELRKRGGQAGISQVNAANAGQESRDRANAANQNMGMLFGAGSMMMGGSGSGSSAPKQQSRTTAGEPYYNPNYQYAKQGGIVQGEPTEHDSQPYMLQPGEFVVRKKDVPNMLKKAHTDDDGEFDTAGFLDTITGHKYGYSR